MNGMGVGDARCVRYRRMVENQPGLSPGASTIWAAKIMGVASLGWR